MLMKFFKTTLFVTYLLANAFSTLSMSSADTAIDANKTSKTLDIEKLKELKELVDQEPNNFEAHLSLADYYVRRAKAELAIEQAQKAFALDASGAERKRVYTILSFAHYYLGNLKSSYELSGKALQINPNDKDAQAVKKWVEDLSQRDFGGKLLEKQGFGGYKNFEEYIAAAQEKHGLGASSLDGKKDFVTFGNFQVSVAPPAEWDLDRDARLPNGTTVNLLYSKMKGSDVPIIGVTSDLPPESIKTAVDFSRHVRKLMLEGESRYNLQIDEPRKIVINKYQGSYMQMKYKDNGLLSCWYQFLIEGRIVSFQYGGKESDYVVDAPVFKNFVESFKIER